MTRNISVEEQGNFFPYERTHKGILSGKAPELRPYENEQNRLLSGKAPELRPYENE